MVATTVAVTDAPLHSRKTPSRKLLKLPRLLRPERRPEPNAHSSSY